jgi:outer membrane protein TolC
MTRTRVLLLLFSAHLATSATAETYDRDAVLRIARERASAMRIADAREDLATGRFQEAATWRFNPELELAGGPRRGPTTTTWDRSIRLNQRLDLAGRGARVDAAGAELEAVEHDSRFTEISVVALSARLHLEAVHAAHAHRLAMEAVRLHDRLLEIAQRRMEAGETGRIDVHQASIAAARARIHLATAEAAERDALTDLADLLALEPGQRLEVAGELEWPTPGDEHGISAAVANHPEIASLEARSRAGAAELRLAGAARWPEVGLGAGYGREEEADILRFGLSFGLPVFERGQGARRIAAAESRIAEIELAAARRSRTDRAMRAWNRYLDLDEALRSTDDATIAALAATGKLAEQSYQFGEIPLDRVLLFERENLDAKDELNDLRLAVALAALQVAELAALPPLVDGMEDAP